MASSHPAAHHLLHLKKRGGMELIGFVGGRPVYIDQGFPLTQAQALELCEGLLAQWGQVHPKVVAKIVYEWEPVTWRDCPHAASLEEALEELAEELAAEERNNPMLTQE